MQPNTLPVQPIQVRKSGTTYTRGKYSVTVGTDGAIQVKIGDQLSNYSAAIYGNYWTVEYFYRKGPTGKYVPIRKPYWIRAGEILYYDPTWSSTVNERHFVGATIQGESQSDLERKRLAVQHFTLLHPEMAETIGKILFWAHTAAEFAEIFEALEDLATPAGAILFPIEATVEIVNAYSVKKRAFFLRGRAYGITSWVFGDDQPLITLPSPPSSLNSDIISQASVQQAEAMNPGDRELQRWVEQTAVNSQADASEYRRAWKEGFESAIRDIDQMLLETNIRKGICQAIFQDLNDDDPNTLLTKIMNEMAEDMPWNEGRAFLEPPARYPSQ